MIGPPAPVDETHPPQDRGAHDALAELGLCDQQRTQPVRRDAQDLHWTFRIGIDQGGTARQLRQLAHE